MKRGRWMPDTERVREWYATWPTTSADTRVNPDHLAEFDRWLAAHDREVKAEALRDAADAIDGERRHDLDSMAKVIGTREFWKAVAAGKERAAIILRERADRMA